MNGRSSMRWFVVIFFSLLWLSAMAVRAEPPADEKALAFFETSDLPPVTVPVVKLLFAAPLGQPLHFVEA
jgi:hypothetical protein